MCVCVSLSIYIYISIVAFSKTMAEKFTDLSGKNNAGEDVDYSSFAGKVVLAVNVARL